MAKRSDRIKCISFDLDGTMTDSLEFENLFWDEEVPKIFAEEHNIPLPEAKRIIFNAYDEVGRKDLNWYRPSYWFKRFKLKKDWKVVIEELKDRIKIFPEVKEVLRKLSKDYKLIIFTHTSREALGVKLEKVNIKKYFVRIFSVIDDFNVTKRDEGVYRQLLKRMNLKPKDLIHVGDDYEFDYRIPKRIGIKAILIDRNEEKKGKEIIHDLREIENILK